ncbi:hypothetical protein HELRODRAFT_160984 [Helobdella robusta]|uniref:Uncharacterized protein n=1 Tax=Helobdella robusta TaxID=6412 RepID=T1EQY6_HELRO|nr:hypothetical protein HELRODRAFT_160984 [Helobdella robusta]ESO01815.1 hypothetical protein HELRODRAFT_160984 [Helobdella robusta]
MRSLAVFLMCLATTNAMIAVPDGFQLAEKSWPELKDKKMLDVKQAILKDMPNIGFREFPVDASKYSEEFWYNEVKLVYDKSNNVVEVPAYWGIEPNFELVSPVIGQAYNKVVDSFGTEMPKLKVCVYKNNKEIFSTDAAVKNYARLDVDDDNKREIILTMKNNLLHLTGRSEANASELCTCMLMSSLRKVPQRGNPTIEKVGTDVKEPMHWGLSEDSKMLRELGLNYNIKNKLDDVKEAILKDMPNVCAYRNNQEIFSTSATVEDYARPDVDIYDKAQQFFDHDLLDLKLFYKYLKSTNEYESSPTSTKILILNNTSHQFQIASKYCHIYVIRKQNSVLYNFSNNN